MRTASDLKGKTFAIGAPGSGSTMAMSLFLDHAGMKNDVRIRMEGHQDYPSQLLDGKIQAFSRLGSVPAAVVDEVAASRPINLVDFGPELDRSKFLDKYPFSIRSKATSARFTRAPRSSGTSSTSRSRTPR
ncbi:MAG: hypothetical protein IPG84_04390 [Betaproteobacteria bacterium]|nr:hypothetical protein [Betaproteobacteria bacterium]